MVKRFLQDKLSLILDFLLSISLRFLFIVFMYLAMLILFGIFGT